MNATLWVSIVLGSGSLLTSLYAVWTQIRNRKLNDIKKEGEVELDSAAYGEIANRAAKINSEERIETERWWKEQFDAVKVELKETKDELSIERLWRRTVSRYIRRHQPWDDRMVDIARQHNWPIESPPKLDFNEGFTEEDLD